MSVGRQFNWKGQQRVDVAHLRLVESSIAYDFDTLAGQALGGGAPYILSGFTFASWTAGALPSTLQLITAGGVVFHYPASENGTMLFVPPNRANETLSTTNARVIGSFTASSTNYVGLDYVRLEDSTTSDIVQFIDATTLAATPKTIPLGRVLDYRIHISTSPFSSTTNICPIAIVVTDGSGLITTVTDARSMYFRLAAGGDSPNPLGTYSWPQGRAPEVGTSFTGGDKAITNEKTWKSAIMQRLWEVTGGEYWYSDVTDKNIKWYSTSVAPLLWNSGTSTLTWANLRVALDNSSATVNTITDGSHVMVDGEVGYVELNRYSNTPNLTVSWAATPAAYNALPAPSRPGSRYILFWRRGSYAYSRLDYTPVGMYSGAATISTYGVVKISTVNDVTDGPFAAIVDSVGRVRASGLVTPSGGYVSIGGGTLDNGVRILSFFDATTVDGIIKNLQTTSLTATTTIQATTSVSSALGSFTNLEIGNNASIYNNLSIVSQKTQQAFISGLCYNALKRENGAWGTPSRTTAGLVQINQFQTSDTLLQVPVKLPVGSTLKQSATGSGTLISSGAQLAAVRLGGITDTFSFTYTEENEAGSLCNYSSSTLTGYKSAQWVSNSGTQIAFGAGVVATLGLKVGSLIRPYLTKANKIATSRTRTGGNLVTVACTGHGYSTNDWILITDGTANFVSQKYQITVTGPDAFTYAESGANVTQTASIHLYPYGYALVRNSDAYLTYGGTPNCLPDGDIHTYFFTQYTATSSYDSASPCPWLEITNIAGDVCTFRFYGTANTQYAASGGYPTNETPTGRTFTAGTYDANNDNTYTASYPGATTTPMWNGQFEYQNPAVPGAVAATFDINKTTTGVTFNLELHSNDGTTDAILGALGVTTETTSATNKVYNVPIAADLTIGTAKEYYVKVIRTDSDSTSNIVVKNFILNYEYTKVGPSHG